MANYYEILGVKPGATADQIKKAYKKRAKKLHPDVGGDVDKFQELEEAHRILSDPDERAYYDQHGKAKPAAPADQKKAMLYNMLLGMMGMAIVQTTNPGTDHLIQRMAALITEQIANAKNDVLEMGKLLIKLGAIRKRIKHKGEENVLNSLMQQQVDRVENQIAQAKHATAMFEEGLLFLRDYDYEVTLMLASADLMEALRRQDSGSFFYTLST